MNFTRRQFLFTTALAAAATTKPNVIVIVMDDLGCHDLGYLGAKDVKTPNIDALAKSGAYFTNWYSNAPVCAPARSSILTGRFPAKAGVPTNGKELAKDAKTIAEALKPAGYRTAAIGKWHLGSTNETSPNARGFEYFYGFHSGCVDFYSHRYYWGDAKSVNYHDLWSNREEIFEDGQYLTERITEESVAFINKNKGQPFFSYIAYNAPHYPMHAPAKYVARFAPLPVERRIYAAMISAVDDGIGAIRRALERNGQLENTLIFLLGDNGATVEKRAGLNQEFATAGDNGVFKGFKFSLFDGGHHVPACVSWPARIPKGGGVKELAMSMDIMPTVCNAAGVAIPAGVDGSDILPVLATGAKSPHDALYWFQAGQLAIRRGKWKLVMNGRLYDRRPDGAQPLKGEDSIWLSDLEADPGETKNLRRLHPNVVDELQTLAEKWRTTLPSTE